MIRSWPLLFIVIPLIELYFILVVGSMIGAFWTVVLVVLTAVIGVNLLRSQGMSTLTRAQRNMAQGQIPAMEMMEGVVLAVAGVLLITPGFITDTLGFLCLFPVTRQAIIRAILARSTIQTQFQQRHYQQGGPSAGPTTGPVGGQYDHYGQRPDKPGEKARGSRTIEGDYTRED